MGGGGRPGSIGWGLGGGGKSVGGGVRLPLPNSGGDEGGASGSIGWGIGGGGKLGSIGWGMGGRGGLLGWRGANCSVCGVSGVSCVSWAVRVSWAAVWQAPRASVKPILISTFCVFCMCHLYPFSFSFVLRKLCKYSTNLSGGQVWQTPHGFLGEKTVRCLKNGTAARFFCARLGHCAAEAVWSTPSAFSSIR